MTYRQGERKRFPVSVVAALLFPAMCRHSLLVVIECDAVYAAALVCHPILSAMAQVASDSLYVPI